MGNEFVKHWVRSLRSLGLRFLGLCSTRQAFQLEEVPANNRHRHLYSLRDMYTALVGPTAITVWLTKLVDTAKS